MAGKRGDSMGYTDSTIPNAEQMPPQDVPSSDSDAGEMELLYIWIEEDQTGFIQKQGFNFSPNYRFEMKACADGCYELFCTEMPEHCNVWNAGSIINLTAVVGENGSGKSSLLRYLAYTSGMPIDSVLRPFKSASVMVRVYRINNTVVIIYNCPDDKLKNQTKFQMVPSTYQNRYQVEALLGNQSRIYLTNALSRSKSIGASSVEQKVIVFSPSENNIRCGEFFRKTCGLKMADNLPGRFKDIQEAIVRCNDNADFEHITAVSYHHHLHAKNLPYTHLWSEQEILNFGIANPVAWLKYMNLSYPGRKAARRHYGPSFLDRMNQYEKLDQDPFHSASLHPIDVLTDALVIELVSLAEELDISYETMEHLRDDPCWYIDQHLKGTDNYHDCIRNYYQSAHAEIKELADIVRDCSKTYERINNLNWDAVACMRANCSSTYNRLCEFIDRLMRQEYSFVLKYLLIDMPPLSSGEQALRNIFSWLRLPPSFREILGQDSVPIQDNVLLLLDEVDLYMHPEWQRKFLKYLSDELNAEYPKKHIQIVISTHSPLVLSDIPSGNIIYLEKNDEKCIIARRPDAGESFGANIFSLLKDSFYLKRSLGEFAHARIEEVIRNLNALKKNPGDETLRETCRGYKQLIEIIGEPVIKRKLQNLYADLFDTGPEDAHRRDLAELSRLLESGDPAQREKYRKLLKNILSEAKRS